MLKRFLEGTIRYSAWNTLDSYIIITVVLFGLKGCHFCTTSDKWEQLEFFPWPWSKLKSRTSHTQRVFWFERVSCSGNPTMYQPLVILFLFFFLYERSWSRPRRRKRRWSLNGNTIYTYSLSSSSLFICTKSKSETLCLVYNRNFKAIFFLQQQTHSFLTTREKFSSTKVVFCTKEETLLLLCRLWVTKSSFLPTSNFENRETLWIPEVCFSTRNV